MGSFYLLNRAIRHALEPVEVTARDIGRLFGIEDSAARYSHSMVAGGLLEMS